MLSQVSKFSYTTMPSSDSLVTIVRQGTSSPSPSCTHKHFCQQQGETEWEEDPASRVCRYSDRHKAHTGPLPAHSVRGQGAPIRALGEQGEVGEERVGGEIKRRYRGGGEALCTGNNRKGRDARSS